MIFPYLFLLKPQKLEVFIHVSSFGEISAQFFWSSIDSCSYIMIEQSRIKNIIKQGVLWNKFKKTRFSNQSSKIHPRRIILCIILISLYILVLLPLSCSMDSNKLQPRENEWLKLEHFPCVDSGLRQFSCYICQLWS